MNSAVQRRPPPPAPVSRRVARASTWRALAQKRHLRSCSEARVCDTAAPELRLVHNDTGVQVHVFGVEHTKPQPHIGEYILEQRPQCVVVETAMTPEHGSLSGNLIGCGDWVQGSAAFWLRNFCAIAEQIREGGPAGWRSDGGVWRQIVQYHNGEQLAYISALAAGTHLVFGDRPKDITYRRLYCLPTIAQLDQAYAAQVVSNYQDTLGKAPPKYEPLAASRVQQILMEEREAVMCKIVSDCCRGTLAQLGGNVRRGAPASWGPPPSDVPLVVLVVGSAHLPGLDYMWRTKYWKELLGSPDLMTSELMSAPDVLKMGQPVPVATVDVDKVDTEPVRDAVKRAVAAAAEAGAADLGLRRGLVEALLRLQCTSEILADLDLVLPPVPEGESQQVKDMVAEIWGTMRMQLACLPPDMLQQVVAGNNCDFSELLAPLRALRPLNKGPGYDQEIMMALRALNFEVDND